MAIHLVHPVTVRSTVHPVARRYQFLCGLVEPDHGAATSVRDCRRLACRQPSSITLSSKNRLPSSIFFRRAQT